MEFILIMTTHDHRIISQVLEINDCTLPCQHYLDPQTNQWRVYYPTKNNDNIKTVVYPLIIPYDTIYNYSIEVFLGD